MTDYLTEQEQVELLKKWIKEYVPFVILSIIIATCALYGWNYWQNKKNITLSNASMAYDELLNLRAQNNAGFTAKADTLFKEYPNTVYAQMTSLLLARDAAAQQNYNKASHYLDWVIDNSSIASFKDIARLRKARLLLVEKKYAEAMQAINAVQDKSYQGLASEIKGDIYLAQNNVAEAKKMYESALNTLPHAETMRPLLRIKRDNLN